MRKKEKAGKIGSFLLLCVLLTACYSHSLSKKGEYLYIDGDKYISTPGRYVKGKKLGKVPGWGVYRVEGDDELNYAILSFFTSEDLYVKEAFEPSHETITSVYVEYEKPITDDGLIQVIDSLMKNFDNAEKYTFLCDTIYNIGRSIYLAYDGNCVGEYWAGLIAYIDGKYLYLKDPQVSGLQTGMVIDEADSRILCQYIDFIR